MQKFINISLAVYNTTKVHYAYDMQITPNNMMIRESRMLLDANASEVYKSYIVTGTFKLDTSISASDTFLVAIYNSTQASDEWGNLVKTQNVVVKSNFDKKYSSKLGSALSGAA